MSNRLHQAVLALIVSIACPIASADLRFVVQPIMDRDATQTAYQPLADYLSRVSGEKVRLVTAYDYADYWLNMKEGTHYDLILDAPFYVDYRIKHQNNVPLVRVPGLVSYSLVAPSSAGVFDPGDLIGKKIASLIPPAPGGLVMTRMFPNAMRQPFVVAVHNSEEALDLLTQGKVAAAMVPSPLAAQAMAQGKDIAIVATSKQTPHMTLTAAPSVPKAVQDKIRRGLLDADKTDAGRAMLKRIGFERFEATDAKLYDGYSDYLDQQWR